jgi:hypothetical protein
MSNPMMSAFGASSRKDARTRGKVTTSQAMADK